ncbi:MAG TPA: hypothetical protein VKB09_07150 [Thermomicrobiales bacterium]|nr:hypothetical protein [Thermomicrobiales bacterium]
MSDASLQVAGIIFVVVPTIEFGGYSLLRFLTRNEPGYLDNPTRRALFTAGHAHAGVLVLMALVGLLYVDQADLSDGTRSLVRTALASAPILMPLGFFLSIASPRATRPNRLIGLVYAGAASLAIGAVTLGVGVLRAS